MIRLVGTELRRMWRRRMPWILLLGVSTAILVAGVVTFVTSDSRIPDPGNVAAETDVQVAECRVQTIEEWNAWNQGEMPDIDPGYEEYLTSFESAEAMADEQCDPRYFDENHVQDPRFCLISLYEPTVGFRQGCPDLEGAENIEYETTTLIVDGEQYRSLQRITKGIVPSTSLFLFVIATVVGASFIGAEYKSGTIETVLLWEPRRIRVLGSKLGAAAVSAFVLHMFFLGLLVLTMLPAAVWRGSTAGADSEFWIGLLSVIVGGGVAASATAAIALSVAVVTRNTVGGVAVLLGYTVVSPILTLVLLRSIRPFDLTENMAAFANRGEVGRFIATGSELQSVYSHGFSGAALIVAIYVSIAVTVAMVVFHRRDID